eukprot:CAMPEP_0172153806 /NCGR_PEP_ID=MMETSP1050-20130122/1669_1 /TAXON_ID=233186 /ORGANISM="Cryptomonas curvata, Strain CCAP979/52" /LENGTH=305 /DNA_ID=CAMNT_0012822423 /DNA_START=21 /DNA_END=935 /DNA_ORIENTATION=+
MTTTTATGKRFGAILLLLFAVAQSSSGAAISGAVLRVRGGSAAAGEITNRWKEVPMAPADPILGVAVAFNADPSPQKINLGIGAYRTSEGKPLVLRCIRAAEQSIVSDPALNKEYLPVQGLEAFLSQTAQVIFGTDSPLVKEERIAVVQTLSGTGALRVAAEFISMYRPGSLVYISDPSWGNHHTIFKKAGLQTKTYRYLTPAMGLDIDGLIEDLNAAPKGSVFVLHTVAHNPTGVDPTDAQWDRVLALMTERRSEIFPVFDSAYQGLARGLEEDVRIVRKFLAAGLEFTVTQSYSKNFGLYGER